MITLGIGVGSVLLLTLIVLGCWVRVSADKAVVVTGIKKRALIGRGGFWFPPLESKCTISLENIKMGTEVNQAPSKQGVRVNVEGTAVVKVSNETDAVYKAVEQFCNGGADKTVENIRTQVDSILEGKLRGIIATLTYEEIQADRTAFEMSIEKEVKAELNTMGLSLVSYTIRDVDDDDNYLTNKSRPQLAQAKADADIAEADRHRDATIKTAEANRLGMQAKLNADALIAESEKDKTLKTESYRADQAKAKADADAAGTLRQIEKNKEIEISRAELAEKEAVTTEKKLLTSVVKPAEADKLKLIQEAEANAAQVTLAAKANADAIKLEAQAQADAIRMKGVAEAEAIKAKGLAEAEAKVKLANAYSGYGDAAKLDLIMAKLPEIAESIAKPLASVDNISIVGDGSGMSKLSKTVLDLTTQTADIVKATTGQDIASLIGNLVGAVKSNPND